MYKQHQVVLVATDKATTLVLNTINNRLLINKDETLVERILPKYGKNQNLYILSEEKIEAGDWYYCIKTNNVNRVFEKSNCPYDKKIIASTDKSLTKYLGTDGNGFHESRYLPQIPQSFVEYFIIEFNKGNIIDKVNVDYEEVLPPNGNYMELVEIIKINTDDNCINIKPIKESWSREEVIELIHQYSTDINLYNSNYCDNWIEQNL